MPRTPDMQSAPARARSGHGIEPGDVVGLRSGGPRMTVESVTPPDGVTCTWWCSKTGDMCVATFVAATLERDGEQ